MNDEIKKIMALHMFEYKITKLQLSKKMQLSYPTMLSKLLNPQNMKISEFCKLCDILNLDAADLLTNYNY